MDPDITITAKEGLYLVYLYDVSISTVYLSMNQGATQHRNNAERHGATGVSAERVALAELRRETEMIREALDPGLLWDLSTSLELGSDLFLPAAYEAGNIASVTYRMDDLPSNTNLVHDLQRFQQLYAACFDAQAALAASNQVATTPQSSVIARRRPEPVLEFRPKSAADYVARITSATQHKTRKHEALVALFGDAVKAVGGEPYTSVHPRDMIVYLDGQEWLIEAKTVGPAAYLAVREAIGQLMEYRHFFYQRAHREKVRPVALFSAPIGKAYEQLLEELSIDYVIRDGSRWHSSLPVLNLISSV